MLRISNKRLARWLLFLLLVGLTLPSSGCLAAAVTAGVVGAGAAGYAYYQGAEPRDYPVGMDQTWTATQLALGDLGMPIVSGQRDNDSATIQAATGAGDKVTITLTPHAVKVPADGPSTNIAVRVGMFGDGPVSERVLNQIDSRLSLTRTPVPQVPVATAQPPYQTAAQPSTSGQLVPVVTGQPTYQTGAPPLAGGQ